MQFPINLLLAGIIVVLAWILNLSTICAMRSLNSRTSIIYGFLSSMCVANLFLATIDFPPSIISNVLVSRSLQHILCVSWTYLDTLICNIIILHLLGSSLDCYLRLRHQTRYMSSTKHILTCLKLSAPWTLSFIQSTAFMAIAHISESTLEDEICLISDPNFLILRSVMCFGVPISCSAVLIFLSAKGLSNLEHPITNTENTISKNIPNPELECSYELFPFSPSTRIPGINRDDTLETIIRSSASEDNNVVLPTRSFDYNNVLNYYQHQCPRHGLLALPLNQTMPVFHLTDSNVPTHSNEVSCKCCPPQHSNIENCQLRYACPSLSTEHCPDLIPLQQPPSANNNENFTSTQTDSNSLSIHHSKSSGNIVENAPIYRNLPSSQSLDIQRIYNSLLFQDNPKPIIQSNSSKLLKQRQAMQSQERTTVAINLAICIFTILLWGPFIIGSLIQGVCKPPYCILPISNSRINEFKWISYILCIIYPILFIIIDIDIRKAIRSSISL